MVALRLFFHLHCVDSYLVVVEVVSMFLDGITYFLVSSLVSRTTTRQRAPNASTCSNKFKFVCRLSRPGRSDRPAAGRTMHTQHGSATQHRTSPQSTAQYSTARTRTHAHTSAWPSTCTHKLKHKWECHEPRCKDWSRHVSKRPPENALPVPC